MLNRCAHFAVTRPRMVLVVALALLIAAFAYGNHVADRLAGGGFLSERSESERAAELLSQRFHAGKPNIVILATNTQGGSVDDPECRLRRTTDYATARRHDGYRHRHFVLERRRIGQLAQP